MKYSYEITSRAADLGGGWRLRLLEENEEVGGGVFPVPVDEADVVMAWWDNVPKQGRAHWVEVAKSSIPAVIHRTYMLAVAHEDAEAVAHEWLDSRETV